MTIKEPSHPSTTQTDVNIEDYLVDLDVNVVKASPSSGETCGHNDADTAVP
ncbi:hypothetical protein ACLOJK_004556 [Asimina triloba]